MTSSFQDNIDVKNTMLLRAEKHWTAGHMKPTPLAWSDGDGSVVGCAIESVDLLIWTDSLGLPKWLALVIDEIASGLTSRDVAPQEACKAGLELLKAIPVGVDLGQAGSKFIISLLADVDERLVQLEQDKVLGQIYRALVELHHGVIGGDQPDATQWRAMRKSAVELTNNLPEGSEVAALAGVVEAAMWDARTSPSVGVDTLRQFSRARSIRAVVEFGWTEADEAHTKMRLDDMFKRFLKDNPENKRTVFDHYADEFPEEEARLRRRIAIERDARCIGAELGRIALSNVLGAASKKQ
ncbi:hypothetical protein PATSB16_09500 [Pandoraea thiooxydans]|uniref:Uncharacterized protein n=1 Tax=Pandoraea thiooxydans TaxID=445709 RepID=A0A0G3EMQ5_9BURK|nr:hypothetical protein [Pandoraea thiooxydans]AKJ67289.1 hypothetical protein ABW99_02625 [Pandoraea thiooxydans]APR94292.1 hypothetical protein PATSB16_09500 [Pandoraea thiooxydans]